MRARFSPKVAGKVSEGSIQDYHIPAISNEFVSNILLNCLGISLEFILHSFWIALF